MAITSILFDRKLVSIGNELGIVELDCSVQETHVSSAKVTRYPVEEGSDIYDHVQQEPDGLTLEGVFTNSPISIVPQIPGVDDNRAQELYEDLIALKESAQPVDVVTTLREYEDMVIESVQVPRNARWGKSVRVTIQLTNVRKVSAQEVESPDPEPEAAKPKVDKGNQPATEVGADKQTIIKKNFGGKVSGFLGL